MQINVCNFAQGPWQVKLQSVPLRRFCANVTGVDSGWRIYVPYDAEYEKGP